MQLLGDGSGELTQLGFRRQEGSEHQPLLIREFAAAGVLR